MMHTRDELYHILELCEIALENVPSGAAFEPERTQLLNYMWEVEAILGIGEQEEIEDED